MLYGRNLLGRPAYQTLNRIELDKNRVLHNIRVIKRQHQGFGVMPVVKANAYGHGLLEVVSILNDADCGFLVVDSYYEAAQIRRLSKHPILVLGYIRPENAGLLDTKRCSFVIQDIAGLQAFGRLRKPVRVHMELNTGMNRLGLSRAEIEPYLQTLKKFPKLELEGVMTHLADADNETNDDFTQEQVKLFDQMVEEIRNAGFSPTYIHIAQTAGSTKVHSQYANAIRLGIGLYGINPLSPTDKHSKALTELLPVMELKSTIIKIIDLEPGDRVSYNGIFTAAHNMRIGVLPVGYYEGVPRELSNRGIFTSQDHDLPIVGRVCMNHTMVSLEHTDLQVGDEVTVISNDANRPNSVAGICKQYGLFSYVLLTSLANTTRRVIV